MKAPIFIFLLVLCACCSKPNHKRPNIVFIMTDDHAYQAISAYGSEISKLAPTPHIDRLAKEGIRFNKAFVENSICTPSRACLMTGLYSHQNGQRQLQEGIDTTLTFVSERFQKAGYQTALTGKWHMRCEPKGFDFYHILNHQGQYYNPDFKSHTSNGKYVREEGYATNLITDHAIQFLETRDKKKPFILFVHHKAPHRNWMPETKYLDLYEDVAFPLPVTFKDDYKGRCSAASTQSMTIALEMEMQADLKVSQGTEATGAIGGGLTGELARMSPAQRAAWENAYGPKNKKFMEQNLKGDELIEWKYQRYLKDYLRCVKSVDDNVGRITEYLTQEGLLDNTVVIYTSDQGFYLGEHGWFDKRFMYEQSYRTPLIIRYPNLIEPGMQNNSLVQNIDFVPTLLALADIEKPAELTGLSLQPLFSRTTPSDWRTSLYYHYYDYPAYHNVRRHDGVRTDQYKLIHFYGKGGVEGATNPMQKVTSSAEYRFMQAYAKAGKIGNDQEINCNELYDLLNDPDELNNLFGQPGYEKITAELQAILDQYRRELKVDEF